ALAAGYRVTCATRGVSGRVPAGTTHVRWDRTEPVPAGLGADADLVVDVSRSPGQVRRAVAAMPQAHWVFVSTVSVYADTATRGATTRAAVVDPVDDEVDLHVAPEAYGGMKVACERAVRDGTRSSAVVRPGLIVGPGDPTGRFTYWPVHAAAAHRDGRPLLVPGEPDDPVQVIDVRDLAQWLVVVGARRTTGTFDAVTPPFPRSALVAALHEATGHSRAVYVPGEVLDELGVTPWDGPTSLPLWISDPGYGGFLARDPAASLAAGLLPRPLVDTVRDTLTWVEATPGARVSGLDREAELDVLARSGLG
ncbi:MAG TPA: epimerase, partial [Actinotalea sp.]|nr:epimerase [Actinotalea sp.]